ncbi:MAG: hypothetical protein ABH827_03745 [bacterium]
MHKKTTLVLLACLACMIFMAPQSLCMAPADQSSSEPAISQQELAEIQADIKTVQNEINSPQFKQELTDIAKELQLLRDNPELLDGPLEKFNKKLLIESPQIIRFPNEPTRDFKYRDTNGHKPYRTKTEFDIDEKKYINHWYNYDKEKDLYVRDKWTHDDKTYYSTNKRYIYDKEKKQGILEEEYYKEHPEKKTTAKPEDPKKTESSKEQEPSKKHEDFKEKSKPLGLSLGLYGKDCMNLLFIMADCFVDRMFYTQLKKDYSELIAKNLIEKKATIMPLLIALNNNPKDTKKATLELKTFLTKECFPNFIYTRDLTLRKFTRMLKYMVTSESVRFIKDWAITPDTTNKKPQLFSSEEEWEKYSKRFQILPISSIVSTLMFLVFGYGGSPLETYSSFRQTLLKLSQALITDDPANDTFLTKTLNIYSKCTDSYIFDVFKKTLITTRFTEQSHNYYQKLTTEYIINTAKELTLILRDIPSYEQRAKMVENVNDKKIIENEQKLKNHFASDPNNSFISWWRFKNSCFRWTGIWIEAVILMPFWIIAGHWIYKTLIKKQETQPLPASTT